MTVMAERLNFLFRWKRLGGHVHVSVFAGTKAQANNQARPNLGTLVMDDEDWNQFQQLVGIDFGERPHVEFKEHTLSVAGSVSRPSGPAAGPAASAGTAAPTGAGSPGPSPSRFPQGDGPAPGGAT